jgi:hypothetical protein
LPVPGAATCGEKWQGKTSTDFHRPSDGLYAWCIIGESDERPKFSPRGFANEEDALEEL